MAVVYQIFCRLCAAKFGDGTEAASQAFGRNDKLGHDRTRDDPLDGFGRVGVDRAGLEGGRAPTVRYTNDHESATWFEAAAICEVGRA